LNHSVIVVIWPKVIQKSGGRCIINVLLLSLKTLIKMFIQLRKTGPMANISTVEDNFGFYEFGF